MKVLMINGSPHEKGCTYTALSLVAEELNAAGIETEIVHVGNKAVYGCLHCLKCKGGRCAINDIVNECIEKAESADAYVIGSPVHYAAAGGAITAFLDRFFFAGRCHQYKPGAALVSCRRGGSTAALDQLNKYFTISNMPLVSSRYWNMVHGSCPEDVLKDAEGCSVMRMLGRNMAWLLRSLEAARAAGIEAPEQLPRVQTNFIR